MKKSVFFLLTALCVALTGCNEDWGASDPIDAKVIGVGNMHYDAEHGLYSVMIDSVSYSISEITLFDSHSTTYTNMKGVPELDGAVVTVFTSNRTMGAQAIAGNKTSEEIEEVFRNHVFQGIAVISIILLGLIAIWAGCDLWAEFKKRHKKRLWKQAKNKE